MQGCVCVRRLASKFLQKFKLVMLMNDCVVLGIDIAKLKFDACLVLPGQGSRRKVFSNDAAGFAELRVWVRDQSAVGPDVAVEATGSYWIELAEALHRIGWPVFLLNPAYVKAHGQSRGQRGKTDRIDAALIADFLQKHRQDCEPWQPLPAELEELRELMRLYNDVRGVAASLGQRGAGLRTAAARALQQEVTQMADQFAKRILKAAREHARRHVSLARPVENLQTIKGVGEISALTFVAELPRGRAARSVAAWAGVTPRPYESGASVRKRPKLCKQGSDYVRQSLYWPAVTALRCNPVMQEFARRLEKSGHNKMQRVGAAMHKLVRWASAIIHTGQPFDPARVS